MSRIPPDGRTIARRWLSLKAFVCHVTLLVLVPAFISAAWWQAQRAAAGNTLSYLYVVEWPAFAAVTVWIWWQMIHLPPRAAEDAPGPADAAWLCWDPSSESPELRAYNLYLAELGRIGGTTKPSRVGWRPLEQLGSGDRSVRALSEDREPMP